MHRPPRLLRSSTTSGARAARVGIVAALAVGLAGCAGQPAPGVIAESRTDDSAPAQFRNREPLPSCGAYDLGQSGPLPADAVACMNDSAASGAELTVSSSTTDDDTVVTYYRTGPEIEGFQLFVDATRHRSGTGTWSEQSCVSDEFVWPLVCG